MIVSLVVVTFSEPLGIGVAVTPAYVLLAADACEGSIVLREEAWVSAADEVLAAAPLSDEDNSDADIVAWVLAE